MGDFLEPKQIRDPDEKKPEDWVDEAEIDDPEDKKPDGYDDIPAKIADPKATKPDDWDDESDGTWEAPQIDTLSSRVCGRPSVFLTLLTKGCGRRSLLTTRSMLLTTSCTPTLNSRRWVSMCGK